MEYNAISDGVPLPFCSFNRALKPEPRNFNYIENLHGILIWGEKGEKAKDKQ